MVMLVGRHLSLRMRRLAMVMLIGACDVFGRV